MTTSRSIARVLELARGQHHAAGRVQLRVRRVAVEHPLELARLGRERVQPGQRRLGQRRVGRLRIERDAGVRRPRTRNTLPASAARNLAGTVSRFLASSECSKVPWKAKAHVRQMRRVVQSIRGGGVGGAPPPRTGFASGTYPTSPHSATQLSSFVPLDLNPVTSRTSKWRICRRFREVGARSGARLRAVQDRLQSGRLHADLRGIRACA